MSIEASYNKLLIGYKLSFLSSLSQDKHIAYTLNNLHLRAITTPIQNNKPQRHTTCVFYDTVRQDNSGLFLLRPTAWC